MDPEQTIDTIDAERTETRTRGRPRRGVTADNYIGVYWYLSAWYRHLRNLAPAQLSQFTDQHVAALHAWVAEHVSDEKWSRCLATLRKTRHERRHGNQPGESIITDLPAPARLQGARGFAIVRQGGRGAD